MSEPSSLGAPALRSTTIRVVVSRKKFESVPRKRAIYIGLYVISFIFWVCLAFYYLRLAAEIAPPDDAVAAETADPTIIAPAEEAMQEAILLPIWARFMRILIALCIALFYIPFISVLRIMGYPWIAVFAFCGFALAPIPGLLIVAYMDTRIAKAWNNAELKLKDAASPGGVV